MSSRKQLSNRIGKRYQKQDSIFLPVFVDKDKKPTFTPYRLEAVESENEKGEKVKTMKLVENDMAKDNYGDNYYKPMNRKARRLKLRELRLYEKKHGKRLTEKEKQEQETKQ